MDLQKEFENIDIEVYDSIEGTYYTNLKDNEVNELIGITEKYAVEFSKWLIKKCDFQKHGVWLFKGMVMTQEELLEVFKHDSE